MIAYRRARGLALLLLAGLLAGCGVAGRTRTPAPSDPSRTGAALASVVVHNATAQALVIAFRPAASAGGEVIVGRVEAGSYTMLAPVPADEPIILLARTAERRQLELAPRTFQIRDQWTWRIPADATFREPAHETTTR